LTARFASEVNPETTLTTKPLEHRLVIDPTTPLEPYAVQDSGRVMQ